MPTPLGIAMANTRRAPAARKYVNKRDDTPAEDFHARFSSLMK
jgi:hypothetical protein